MGCYQVEWNLIGLTDHSWFYLRIYVVGNGLQPLSGLQPQVADITTEK